MDNRMRVGIFGFGQTGKLLVQQVLEDAECELKWVVRRAWEEGEKTASRLLGWDTDEGELMTPQDVDREDFFERHPVDCLIDFSSHDGITHYRHAVTSGVRVVSAVSHYGAEDRETLRGMAESSAVLWSPNITLGINFVMTMARVFREMVPSADAQIIEEHFAGKKGVSGTALRMAASLGIEPEGNVHSVRAGGIVGRHTVVFGLPNQVLRFSHESITRSAFGRGALLAAKWLRDKAPGSYTMEDLIRDQIRSKC